MLALTALIAAAPPVRAAGPPPSILTVLAYTYLPGSTDTPEIPLFVARGGHLLFAPLDTLGFHSIVSVDTFPDSTPLFWSDQIGPSQTRDVNGVPGLGPGTYRFYCSNHPDMRGNLTVMP